MMPSVHATDRRLTVVMICSGILTVGMLVLFIVAVPAIFSSKDNSSQVRRGNELQACRSEYNAALAIAQDQVEDARAERDNLVLVGLAATATGDKEFLASLAQATPQAIEKITAARAEKTAAAEEYADAVKRSREHPDQFLAECQDGS